MAISVGRVTRLGNIGIPRMPYGSFAGKSEQVGLTTATKFFTIASGPAHYTITSGPAHYTIRDSK